MKSKIIITGLILFIYTLTSYGQYSGNNVIGQNSYNNRNNNTNITNTIQSVNKLQISDTSFIIQSNILMNVIADSYVATFGLADTSKSLKKANENINKRISNFISALKKMGIQKDDIYVDMTTQTQLTDYKVKLDYDEQYISGFEIKKNVIVKFKKLEQLDKMLIKAEMYNIYNLAKVDYIVEDINSVYVQLFQKSMEIINQKKELYSNATNLTLKTNSIIYGENFHSVYPSNLYSEYSPNVAAMFYYNRNYKTKVKNLGTLTTYYYNKLNYSGFDKVINPIITEPAIEFVLKLQIQFFTKNE